MTTKTKTTKAPTHQVCAACQRKLKLDAFGRDARSPSGYNRTCRACRRRSSNERNAFLRALKVDAGFERAEALEVAKALRAGLTGPLAAPARRKPRGRKGGAS